LSQVLSPSWRVDLNVSRPHGSVACGAPMSMSVPGGEHGSLTSSTVEAPTVEAGGDAAAHRNVSTSRLPSGSTGRCPARRRPRTATQRAGPAAGSVAVLGAGWTTSSPCPCRSMFGSWLWLRMRPCPITRAGSVSVIRRMKNDTPCRNARGCTACHEAASISTTRLPFRNGHAAADGDSRRCRQGARRAPRTTALPRPFADATLVVARALAERLEGREAARGLLARFRDLNVGTCRWNRGHRGSSSLRSLCTCSNSPTHAGPSETSSRPPQRSR